MENNNGKARTIETHLLQSVLIKDGLLEGAMASWGWLWYLALFRTHSQLDPVWTWLHANITAVLQCDPQFQVNLTEVNVHGCITSSCTCRSADSRVCSVHSCLDLVILLRMLLFNRFFSSWARFSLCSPGALNSHSFCLSLLNAEIIGVYCPLATNISCALVL